MVKKKYNKLINHITKLKFNFYKKILYKIFFIKKPIYIDKKIMIKIINQIKKLLNLIFNKLKIIFFNKSYFLILLTIFSCLLYIPSFAYANQSTTNNINNLKKNLNKLDINKNYKLSNNNNTNIEYNHSKEKIKNKEIIPLTINSEQNLKNYILDNLNNDNSFSIGIDSNASGLYSTALGKNSKTNNSNTLAVGYNSEANGNFSTSLGSNSIANGVYSTAIGNHSNAEGKNSTVIGNKTYAKSDFSTAIGNHSISNRDYLDKEVIRRLREYLDDKTTVREVSIGDASDQNNKLLSQITHVAPAIEKYDVTNLDQVNKLIQNKLKDINLENIEDYKQKIENIKNQANDAVNKTLEYKESAKLATTEIENEEKTAISIIKNIKNENNNLNKIISLENDNTINIGNKLNNNNISIIGNNGNRIINGVSNGIKNNDAVNMNQLNSLKNKSNFIEKKLTKSISASSALSGLFQPYSIKKPNISISFGGFDKSESIAIGAGYRINESTAIKCGIALSDLEPYAYNISMNIEF